VSDDPAVQAPQSRAVIATHPASGDKPQVTYRWAGDRSVLVEYGPMELDVRLSFFALAIERELSRMQIPGLRDLALGFRSLLIGFDGMRLRPQELVSVLDEVHAAASAPHELTLASRRVRLPIAFDDSQSARAVARYSQSIRPDSPNCEGGTNIDYIVAYNGMAGRQELFDTITRAEFFTAFIGFFPGLPFMLPLDPRDTISAPKYNPTRTWTPEGAVGMGGPSFSIYPVESAGGYQLFGRSMPIYDIEQRNAAFRDDPLLLRAGDRLSFYAVSEAELDELRAAARAGELEFEIEEGTFSVAEHLRRAAAVADEAAALREKREAAAARTPVP
jgi:urea carboxylase